MRDIVPGIGALLSDPYTYSKIHVECFLRNKEKKTGIDPKTYQLSCVQCDFIFALSCKSLPNSHSYSLKHAWNSLNTVTIRDSSCAFVRYLTHD